MRCFIAVDLPDDLREGVVKLQSRLKAVNVKTVKKENLHFTLKFLGEIEEDKIHPISFQADVSPSGFDALHHKFTVECYERLNIMKYSEDGFSLKYIVGVPD